MPEKLSFRERQALLPKVIAHIKMYNDPEKIWLLVEGPHDTRVFLNFVDSNRVNVKEVLGRSNVDAGVSQLASDGNSKVFGIADADDEAVAPSSSLHERVFTTDYRDLEVMIFFSACGETTVRNFLKRPISLVLARDYESLANRMTSELAKVGACKVANQLLNLGLSFQKVEIAEFLETRLFTIDLDSYVERLFVDSSKTHTEETRREFRRLVDELLIKHPQSMLVPGHDLAKYLAVLFGSPYARKGTDLTHQAVEQLLRKCYAATGSHFAGSQLCRRLAEHVPLSQTVWQHLERETA